MNEHEIQMAHGDGAALREELAVVRSQRDEAREERDEAREELAELKVCDPCWVEARSIVCGAHDNIEDGEALDMIRGLVEDRAIYAREVRELKTLLDEADDHRRTALQVASIASDLYGRAADEMATMQTTINDLTRRAEAAEAKVEAVGEVISAFGYCECGLAYQVGDALEPPK